MTTLRLYVPRLDPGRRVVALPADEAHHALRVLRLRVGAGVRVFDGLGHEWMARLSDVSRSGAAVVLEHAIAPLAEPAVRVTLGVALLKGHQMDAVVRDAVMLGAATIVPLVTEHVAVASTARTGGRVIARWRRVAVASARQCGRALVPDVTDMRSIGALIEGADVPLLVCTEPAAGAATVEPMALAGATPREATVLVGPEGGWAPRELERLAGAGATFVRLGPRTLRAEAAPAIVLASLWTVWGWGG